MIFAGKTFFHLNDVRCLDRSSLERIMGLYETSIAKTNHTIRQLNTLAERETGGEPEFSRVKQTFGSRFAHMRFFELFFENIGVSDGSIPENSMLFKKIKADFGSFGNWLDDFRRTAGGRGPGWTVLYYDLMGERFFNARVDSLGVGNLTCAVPMLVMGLWAESEGIGGKDNKRYIEDFLRTVDWKVVEDRFKAISKLALREAVAA